MEYIKNKSERPPPKACIGPSILNADLSQLFQESKLLIDNGADYLHLDVMDGCFVPNLTFGPPVVKCLRNKMKNIRFETHMMVSQPQNWIEAMADATVDQYTFHIEPLDSVEIPNVCRKVHEAGMAVGLAIKPDTPIHTVDQYIDRADMILIMTVEPGFGGQTFMYDMLPKIEYLRKHYPHLEIEVDGGVNLENIECIAKAGANRIVAGTAITKAENQRAVMQQMSKCVHHHALNN